ENFLPKKLARSWVARSGSSDVIESAERVIKPFGSGPKVQALVDGGEDRGDDGHDCLLGAALRFDAVELGLQIAVFLFYRRPGGSDDYQGSGRERRHHPSSRNPPSRWHRCRRWDRQPWRRCRQVFRG